ncbi:MAG: hypothetical protein OIN66_13700, partial [Candidatus Methanoperedens sp.]|nr:hypothetical protein [Candidatus Methanoperedens sp.]
LNLLNHFVAMWASDSGIVTWKWYLEYLWSYGLYYPIFITFVGGIILIAKRREKAGVVLLSIFLVYGTVLISKTYYTDRLLLSIAPTVAVISAYFLSNILEHLQSRNFVFNNLKIHGRAIGRFIILVIFGISFLKVAIGSFYLSQPTPLQQTEVWIDENVPAGSRIFFSAGSFPFSPNNLEKNYDITYYSPEMAQYPIDVFSLKYDYIIYYWGGNLPTEFNLTLAQMDAKKTFDFKIPDNLPLKPFVKLSSPWFSARLSYSITSSIIPLNNTVQSNYAFIDGVYYENGILRGNILYFKSNLTDKNRFLVTRDLIRPVSADVKEAKHDFKPSLKPIKLIFSLDMKTKNFSLKPADTGFNPIGMERDLVEFINREFNLVQDHETSFEQSNEDLVSYAGVPQPSGRNDFLITVRNVSKPIEKVQIINRNRDQTWVGPHDGIHPTVLYKQDLNSRSVSIYIEPVEGVQDAILEVYLFYTDSTVDIIGNR